MQHATEVALKLESTVLFAIDDEAPLLMRAEELLRLALLGRY